MGLVTDAYRSLLWYLLVGTRGGPNRARILDKLADSPQNAHRLAETLSLDYRTVRHHLLLLERNGIVTRPVGDGYAAPYELSPHLALHYDVVLQVRSGDRAARRRPILMTVSRAESGPP
jgi:DNA-binding transcriptional ArsR family regulator